MAPAYVILQSSVFERLESNSSWKALSEKHAIRVGALSRVYASWEQNYPKSQPVAPKDIHLPLCRRGRLPALMDKEEDFIAESVFYYADNNTPLTRQSMRDFVEEYVFLLPKTRQEAIGFHGNRPSKNWVTSFMKRNGLKSQHVELMEDKRVKAVSAENLAEHIARVKGAIQRYNIKDPRFIFNTDQSGSSFDKMKERSLRKGIGAKEARLVQKALTTKGNLDRVTVMSVVSASGVAYKPAIVFPGTLAHHRKVNGQIQTLHSVLPPCYLFQPNPPGADSDIVFEWAKLFVEETSHLPCGGHRLLLLLDGYGAHVQFKTLRMLRESNVIVIALPSHTSHRTQPLDVGVFSSYKSFLQSELHKAARQKTKLNAFDVGQCISNDYYSSHTAPNIRSGFHKTGIWDVELLRPNIAPLERYLLQSNGNRASAVTVQNVLNMFEKRQRTLLRDALVEEEGHVRVNTTAGAHLTSDAVLEALEQRSKARKEKQKHVEALAVAAAYKEPKADIRRLVQLAPIRSIRRVLLAQTRKARRELRKAKARSVGFFGQQ